MEFKYEGKSLKSGVYKITNIQNPKWVYFGEAKEFKSRWNGHRKSFEAGKHQNKHMLNVFNKHGPDVFVFEILEVVPSTGDRDKDKLQRTIIETRYIKEWLDGGGSVYNTQLITTQTQGPWSNTPEETKKKMRKAKPHVWTLEERKEISKKLTGHTVSQETREKLRQSNFGKKHTAETKEKLRKINTGRKLPPLSPEVREKLSKALKGRKAWNKGRKLSVNECQKLRVQYDKFCRNPSYLEKRKLINLARVGKKDSPETILKKKLASKTRKHVKAIDIATNKEFIFDSIRTASKVLKIFESNITRILRGEAKSAKGYSFQIVS